MITELQISHLEPFANDLRPYVDDISNGLTIAIKARDISNLAADIADELPAFISKNAIFTDKVYIQMNRTASNLQAKANEYDKLLFVVQWPVNFLVDRYPVFVNYSPITLILQDLQRFASNSVRQAVSLQNLANKFASSTKDLTREMRHLIFKLEDSIKIMASDCTRYHNSPWWK